MTRVFITLIFLVTTLTVFGQAVLGEQEKKIYTGGYLVMKNTVTKAEKPLGKNVKLVIDGFFKNYEITYTDSEGNNYKVTFEYIKGDGVKEGKIVELDGIQYVPMEMFLDTPIGTITFISARNRAFGDPTYEITNLKKVVKKKK